MAWKPKRKASLSLEDFMVRNPISLPENASVDDAFKVMWENRIGSVLIVDSDGKLKGIVTQRDLLYAGCRGLIGKNVSVKEIMSENPITAKPSDSLQEAVRRMRVNDVSHLPVVDDQGRPIGIFSMRDVIDIFMLLVGTLFSEMS
ncbi:MAG: CBS domain-containing protein [Candidatus Korarchaeum sp.]|jgi:CBS domain-containing protein|uniref:Signal-transduction protein with CBS domains n=1 Tax=Korarchaeum cryptofilum (strain OPF8) TaxID=374847 RepID=B1L3I2_KORCO|nr:CBS domain-containing protein [Candidatus Korarchaeum cryptofilum]ACB07011.1 putative signal-transduction protein with CBS domains [Candidatus Korarchaeum cryptofilum OPF8]MCC6028986.1 CBS domain-containing protein [Candidatus Korarchaeum sp.]